MWRDEEDFDWDPNRDRSPYDDTPVAKEHEHHHGDAYHHGAAGQRQATAGETLQQMRSDLVQGSLVIKQCLDTLNEIREAPHVNAIVEELQGTELQQAVRLASAVGKSAMDHFLPVLQQLNALLVHQFQQQQQLETLLYRKHGTALTEIVIQK